MFATIDDVPPEQTLLARVDINAPVEDGIVQDTRRFHRHAATIRELIDAGHAVVVLAHQGRPGGADFVSLVDHVAILEDHLDVSIDFIPETVGERVADGIQSLSSGDILVLENVRMNPDELPEKDPAKHAKSHFVQSLAETADAYVNDAYSAAHRAHASLVGFPLVMDAYAGRVMETEFEANSAIQHRTFDGTVTMVLGGTKAADLIPIIERVSDTVDRFCLGGIVGELFLRAKGYDVGFDVDDSDLFDTQWIEHEETIRDTIDAFGDRIHLPTDLAYEDSNGKRREVNVDEVSKTTPLLDIGSETTQRYAALIRESSGVFVKGALGVFEDERFSTGTVDVLDAIAETQCFSVIGGGDTSRAIDIYGLPADQFSHISIAGGAYVRALTGEPLVAIDVLTQDRR